MPIRPELRKFYGRAWRKYRLALIYMAGYRCARCRAHLPSRQLAAAHLTHDPRNQELVAVLCFACHNRNDVHQRYAMMRRTWARTRGQLWLSPELEWAPYASWMIPQAVIDAQQQIFQMEEAYEGVS
jgi:hypothetical protein